MSPHAELLFQTNALSHEYHPPPVSKLFKDSSPACSIRTPGYFPIPVRDVLAYILEVEQVSLLPAPSTGQKTHFHTTNGMMRVQVPASVS